MSLEAQIEAILFWKAEPVSRKFLAEALGRPEEEILSALQNLERQLAERGVILMWKDEEVLLGTKPEAGELIERLTKEELGKELGKAALETLAIVLYQAPVTRARIDYIRGVNSSFILRHLQIRGLVERIPNPADARGFLYRPTFDLLQHLGAAKVEDLPEFEALAIKLKELSAS
jgi:segregation and condensation protein B